jgi:hypothetical protein
MIRTASLLAACSLLLAGSGLAGPRPAANPAAQLTFDDTTYVHRWSHGNQNEYTTEGDEDLAAWDTMLTILVHDNVRDGDQLAALANAVVSNFASVGKVLSTDSKPRTKTHEAEHYAVAVLRNPKFLEAVFARIMMVEGRAVDVLYAKRFYGAKVDDEVKAWLDENGEDAAEALRGWRGLPSLAAIAALPQSEE